MSLFVLRHTFRNCLAGVQCHYGLESTSSPIHFPSPILKFHVAYVQISQAILTLIKMGVETMVELAIAIAVGKFIRLEKNL